MEEVSICKNILKIKDYEVEFEHEIDKVEYVDGKYIVLVSIPKGSKEVDNLYGVDETGEIIWRVQDVKEAFGIPQNTPYVALRVVNNETVQVTSFFGMRFLVSIKDGSMLEKECIGW